MSHNTLKIFLLLCLLPVISFGQETANRKIVIHVDDVVPAKAPYNTYDQQKVLSQATQKDILVHSDSPDKIIPTGTDGFIQTIHLAYAQHHDLVLSPDDIWIQIALGVSIHINQEFDKLNAQVVNSPKKEEIFVRMDDLASMDSRHWQQLIDTFTVLAKAKIKPDFYQTMLPEFTTSTSETRAVLNAILLSSVKESIGLHGASGCGIPNIVLLGEKQDWEKILAHLDELEQYNLKFWTDELKPIIREFINAYDGKADRQFWQQIYKYRQGYMLEQINGWASKFYPYFTKGAYMEDSLEIDTYMKANHIDPEMMDASPVRTSYYRNPYLQGEQYLLNSIDLESLPASFCSIPLVWNNLLSQNPADHEQHLTLCAGFMGSVQLGKTYQLRNNPVWFIVKRDGFLEMDYDNWMRASESGTDFSAYLWSDKVIADPKTAAVYHPEKNTTAEAGMEELKSELKKHFKKNFPQEDLSETELTFIVSHFGICLNVEIKGGKLSDKAKAELILRMKKLNFRFRPATIAPKDTEPQLETVEYEVTGTSPDIAIPANAQITLTF